jgi:hypothetical protein
LRKVGSGGVGLDENISTLTGIVISKVQVDMHTFAQNNPRNNVCSSRSTRDITLPATYRRCDFTRKRRRKEEGAEVYVERGAIR